MGWSLAWWHNYKWATYRIMSVFAVDFIAPLFHTLFPDRQFNVKMMSVPSATAILSYIRLSYPKVKPELDAAILQGNRVHPSQMILVLNLRDLFEYFIPTVNFLSLAYIYVFFSSFYINLLLVFKMPHCINQFFFSILCLCFVCCSIFSLKGFNFSRVLCMPGARLLFSIEIQPRG